MSLFLTSCTVTTGGIADTRRPASRPPITASTLGGLLLSAGDINSVMATSAMTPNDPFTAMRDHRDLLPNLNCLGIWEVGEVAVYGGSGWTAMRGQVLRQPNTDEWDALVVQAVVSFASADAAQKFYAASSDRWSKCSNHRVNMTDNDHPRTALTFGDLTKTATELTMPLTLGGGRSCQRALAVTSNVIIDVAACNAAISGQAATIVDKIQSKIPV
jgi:hypothetical protein